MPNDPLASINGNMGGFALLLFSAAYIVNLVLDNVRRMRANGNGHAAPMSQERAEEVVAEIKTAIIESNRTTIEEFRRSAEANAVALRENTAATRAQTERIIEMSAEQRAERTAKRAR